MTNRAEERKFHYIYKITRTDGSGKYYIGMHSTDDLDDGYFGSGRLIARSVRKHGKDKHEKEILEFLPSRKELKAREKKLVNEEILDDPRSAAGGKAKSSWSQEAREKHTIICKTTIKLAKMAANKPEVMEKRKVTYAERQHQAGEKNSQYGTCWVTNKEGSVKIKRDSLDQYLSMGYVQGRNMARC
jgi:hypothetical protein